MTPRNDLHTEEGRQKARDDYKRHYYKHQDKYLARNKTKKNEIRSFLQQYKEFHGCMDCKGKFPYYVLDFDHRDPNLKKFSLNRMHLRNSWEQMIEEIGKCDVVCGNCHRIRSYTKGHHLHKNAVTEEDLEI